MPRDPRRAHAASTPAAEFVVNDATSFNRLVVLLLASYSLPGQFITTAEITRDDFLARVPSAANRLEQVRRQDNKFLTVYENSDQPGPKQYVWTSWIDSPTENKDLRMTAWMFDNILNLSSPIPGDIRLGDTVIYRNNCTTSQIYRPDLENTAARITAYLLHKRQEWFNKTAMIRNLASTHKTL